MTAAFARRSPAAVAAALATIYLVWGSTYLAIRVTDRTMPPLLMSSVRFLVAGTALYAFAARGRVGGDAARVRPGCADRGDHPPLVRGDGSRVLRTAAVGPRDRRPGRRLRRGRAARAPRGWR